jgi:hypothetical protein
MNVELPRIRQALFIVDKNRSYKFDVNQTIAIKGLKKMIVAAANLGKSGLRIFHKGTEYTNMEDSNLVDLFPDMQLVEFTISIVHASEEDKEANIKLRLGSYCKKHNFKYPYFYCYDCSASICSICLREHQGHNWIEKYDYLQSSRNLVENIFYDMDELLAGAKMGNMQEIEELKQKIKLEFFPRLIQMVSQIEGKLLDLIDHFIENNTESYENIQKNVGLLKSHCSEGLDRLKSEIAIEDMMLDEEIFLTFDKKFKEIATEKVRIVKDVKKYEDLRKVLEYVFNVVVKIHDEIYVFLEQYLKSTVYDEVKGRVAENVVGTVNKEDILYKLLSDVKRKPGRSSAKKYWSNFGTSSQFDLGESKSPRYTTTLTPQRPLSNTNLLKIPSPISCKLNNLIKNYSKKLGSTTSKGYP